MTRLVSLLRRPLSLLPMPIKQFPWRIAWMRGTSAFAKAPVATSLRLAGWTTMELFRRRLRFEVGRFGFVTMPNNFCGLWSYVSCEFESELLEFVGRTVRSGDVFVDVGANIGIYSTHASSAVGLNGSVIAFEAHPLTAQVARENLALNRCANVTLVNAAVGAEPGTLEMLYERGDSGSTHVAATAEGAVSRSNDAGVSVPVVRLDDKLAGLGVDRVDYLKIDVEGFELFVLRGGRETIRANAGIIVQTEIDRRHLARYGVTPSEVFDLVKSFGLTPHKVAPDGSLEAIEAADYGDVIWRSDTASAVVGN